MTVAPITDDELPAVLHECLDALRAHVPVDVEDVGGVTNGRRRTTQQRM